MILVTTSFVYKYEQLKTTQYPLPDDKQYIKLI